MKGSPCCANTDMRWWSRICTPSGSLSDDIRIEQDKLRRADTVIVQFPLWWFGPPAILKGWFDRLFVQGFAQGVLDPETGRALRYGSGGLVGRRAMVVTTVGANAATTGPRGIHGDINDVLFPILHGTLWYTGMTVVPPLVINGAVRLSGADYEAAARRLRTGYSFFQIPSQFRSVIKTVGITTKALCCTQFTPPARKASVSTTQNRVPARSLNAPAQHPLPETVHLPSGRVFLSQHRRHRADPGEVRRDAVARRDRDGRGDGAGQHDLAWHQRHS